MINVNTTDNGDWDQHSAPWVRLLRGILVQAYKDIMLPSCGWVSESGKRSALMSAIRFFFQPPFDTLSVVARADDRTVRECQERAQHHLQLRFGEGWRDLVWAACPQPQWLDDSVDEE